jgi:restriction system protein
MDPMTEVDAMTGGDFEELCAELLRHMGYRNVWRIGQRGDGGVDIRAVDPYGRRIAVQCKRWKRDIGPAVVRELAGSVRTGEIAFLMTNRSLTEGARETARRHEITVIDRAALGHVIATPLLDAA